MDTLGRPWVRVPPSLGSTYALFMMTDAQVKGNMDAVMSYMHEFYF